MDVQTIRRSIPADLPSSISLLAPARNLDFIYRPWKDGFAMRYGVCSRATRAITTRVFWAAGKSTCVIRPRTCGCSNSVWPCRRSSSFLMVCRGRLRGVRSPIVCQSWCWRTAQRIQAADWHERLTAVRDRIGEELDRLESSQAAARALDLPRLRKLIENWPSSGWEQERSLWAIATRCCEGLRQGISCDE